MARPLLLLFVLFLAACAGAETRPDKTSAHQQPLVTGEATLAPTVDKRRAAPVAPSGVGAEDQGEVLLGIAEGAEQAAEPGIVIISDDPRAAGAATANLRLGRATLPLAQRRERIRRASEREEPGETTVRFRVAGFGYDTESCRLAPRFEVTTVQSRSSTRRRAAERRCRPELKIDLSEPEPKTPEQTPPPERVKGVLIDTGSR